MCVSGQWDVIHSTFNVDVPDPSQMNKVAQVFARCLWLLCIASPISPCCRFAKHFIIYLCFGVLWAPIKRRLQRVCASDSSRIFIFIMKMMAFGREQIHHRLHVFNLGIFLFSSSYFLLPRGPHCGNITGSCRIATLLLRMPMFSVAHLVRRLSCLLLMVICKIDVLVFNF